MIALFCHTYSFPCFLDNMVYDFSVSNGAFSHLCVFHLFLIYTLLVCCFFSYHKCITCCVLNSWMPSLFQAWDGCWLVSQSPWLWLLAFWCGDQHSAELGGLVGGGCGSGGGITLILTPKPKTFNMSGVSTKKKKKKKKKKRKSDWNRWSNTSEAVTAYLSLSIPKILGGNLGFRAPCGNTQQVE